MNGLHRQIDSFFVYIWVTHRTSHFIMGHNMTRAKVSGWWVSTWLKITSAFIFVRRTQWPKQSQPIFVGTTQWLKHRVNPTQVSLVWLTVHGILLLPKPNVHIIDIIIILHINCVKWKYNGKNNTFFHSSYVTFYWNTAKILLINNSCHRVRYLKCNVLTD